MYRVRIVFNAPLQRAHPFVSIAKDNLEDAQQIIEDMRPAIVHAVSVQIQREVPEPSTGRAARWETMSSLEPGNLRS